MFPKQEVLQKLPAKRIETINEVADSAVLENVFGKVIVEQSPVDTAKFPSINYEIASDRKSPSRRAPSP